jgi:hypothetical protein
MGKASSNKKVARVARTGGGRTARGRGSLLWPGVLTLTVVLGTTLIFISRAENQASADHLPPRRGDHWHAAYGFYICDKVLSPIGIQNDPVGIHTHGDGVVHIHPTSVASSGKSATFGRFMEAVNGSVSSSEIKLPGQKTMKNGMKCGKKPGRVETRIWTPGSTTGSLVTGNPANLRFTDHELITIGFVPAGTKLPPPPSAAQLNRLSDVAPPSTVPPTTTASTAPTTTPTTTPAGGVTTAPPATTAPNTTAAGS